MREFLFPEEVYEYIKGLQGFEDYTEEQLYQDLDQLVKWNNLVAIQETNRARTIEEYKKNVFVINVLHLHQLIHCLKTALKSYPKSRKWN